MEVFTREEYKEMSVDKCYLLWDILESFKAIGFLMPKRYMENAIKHHNII